MRRNAVFRSCSAGAILFGPRFCFALIRRKVDLNRRAECPSEKGFSGRCLFIRNTEHQINEEIRDKEVRLIGDDGAQLGVMSGRDALKAAQLKELDLVKIAPTANPPVCRIMDYGKFRFEQAKKDKEAKKRQHVDEIKEIRLSPGIDQHDFDFKVKNAQRFLADGDKVKVAVRFRGREMAHTSIGEQLLAKFAETCSAISSVEKPSKMEGRHMIMFLAPKTIKTP
jgi:translation initiation factor IF-3